MSIGYDISFQKVGLNRAGRYRQSVRGVAGGAGVPARRESSSTGTEARPTDHARWRRISGLTCAVEDILTPKERRAGIGRLVEQMKSFVEARPPLPPLNEGGENDGKRRRAKLDFVGEWEFPVESWARVREEGRSVESLCALFQISRARLTALTKEFCGVSAQELIDGFKIKRLKQLLAERLRAAAEKLWGGPGDLAFLRCCMPTEQSLAGTGGARRSMRELKQPAGSRRYGNVPDFYGQDIGEERENRTAALVAELKKNSEFESAAVRFGFGSAARMNRACLNVFGRSLRELENFLAADVVFYYITAEVKELREIASRETGRRDAGGTTGGAAGGDNRATFRARDFYDGSEEAPTKPYFDLWSAAEKSKGNWLEAMQAAFG